MTVLEVLEKLGFDPAKVMGVKLVESRMGNDDCLVIKLRERQGD